MGTAIRVVKGDTRSSGYGSLLVQPRQATEFAVAANAAIAGRNASLVRGRLPFGRHPAKTLFRV